MDNENYIGVIREPCSNFTPYENFNRREFDNLYDCPVDEMIEETPTETPLSQTDLETKKKMSGLLIALIVIAAVETILVCLISFYMYFAGKNKDSSDEEEDGIELKEETVLNSFDGDETNFNIMIDNPIFNKGFQNESDPFGSDFDDKDDSKGDHFFGTLNFQEN
ncbi:hypothetical protein TVAG_171420 [Trichomonas vaginalis G3]|uniref:Uncharacterized protein n=1 Tax=Trichomonas vaginalis (strain ATCC PRA-98 / G3) TaxID=412133 RepID=A2FZK4_TRIV3|nr:hypothetical protein TVAGG3_0792000 [Trichomonas vaginalis G3]EAX89662.1 hypothetical protein TVAG_171420 [Trichomonas vaginalis G3]KAI5495862.1 hypothetical protein TVAGG3_0792000 [Trichomonas vaginalis G3]|eukprot:XP_001302592.1 hypothetical protein [Trichomonas vaginalis G3]